MIRDDFAGPGGWDEGLRMLGVTDVVGVECDAAACATAVAAGHYRLRADVAHLPIDAWLGCYGPVTGYIASPPCQDFATCGPMVGQGGDRGRLVTEPLRVALELQPAWIAWEQVPLVLPLWEQAAYRLRRRGYFTWTGVLDAADFGVPQHRRRATLMASQSGPVAPPVPTHAADPHSLFGDLLPHTTLAQILDLEPGWIYDSGQNSRAAGGTTERYVRSCDRPAGTVTGQTTSQWVLKRGDDRRKLTISEAARLQTFPADYPFHGKAEERHQQVGDAVPPLLAAHILAALGVGEFKQASAA